MKWENLKLFLACVLHDIGKIHPSYYHVKYHGGKDRHALIPFEINPKLKSSLSFELPHPLKGLKAWEIIIHHHSSDYSRVMDTFRRADRADFHHHLVFAPAQSRMSPDNIQLTDWPGNIKPSPIDDGEYLLKGLLRDLVKSLESDKPDKVVAFIRGGLHPVLTMFPSDNRQPLSHITLWDHGVATYMYLIGASPQLESSNPFPIYPVWHHDYILGSVPKWHKLISGLAHVVFSRIQDHTTSLDRHVRKTRALWERSRLEYIHRQANTIKSQIPVENISLEELTAILSDMMCSPKPPSPREVAIPILLKYIHARWRLGLTHVGTLIYLFGSRKLTLAGKLHIIRNGIQIPAHLPPGKYPVLISTAQLRYPPWWESYTSNQKTTTAIKLTDGVYLTPTKPTIALGSINNPLKRVLPKKAEFDHSPNREHW